jgi:hypothetical protein
MKLSLNSDIHQYFVNVYATNVWVTPTFTPEEFPNREISFGDNFD